MRIELSGLEDYEKLTNEQLRNELVNIHMQIKRTQDKQENDKELQAAIALVQSKKAKYTMRITQLKKLQKSLQLLLEIQGNE